MANKLRPDLNYFEKKNKRFVYENIILYFGKAIIYSLCKGLKLSLLKLQSSQLKAVPEIFQTNVKLALKRCWMLQI